MLVDSGPCPFTGSQMISISSNSLTASVLLPPFSRNWTSLFSTVECTIFNGSFPSLRNLRLRGIRTDLPWRNLTNLTTFEFSKTQAEISVTQLLVFFETAPLLRGIQLVDSLPYTPDAHCQTDSIPPSPEVTQIAAQPAHSILLNHLRIPIGASVTLRFRFTGNKIPISDYLFGSLDNLCNISHVSSIDLSFNSGVEMWLKGPSGDLRVFGS